MAVISLDTETTGIDAFHGAQPFFVTICYDDGRQLWWDWPVDPLTREVQVPESDPREIQEVIDGADEIIGQNLKFDVRALSLLGVRVDWSKVRDTLIAGHLLASNQPHNLTDMAVHYLGEDIEPYELALKEAVSQCRRKVQQARLKEKRATEKVLKTGQRLLLDWCTPRPAEPRIADWRIAEKGLPEMPSAGAEPWKYDTWLPKVYALAHSGLPDLSHYLKVLEEYANTDSAITLRLWQVMRGELDRRGLWSLYQESMRLPPIISRMEDRGVTVTGERLEYLEGVYQGIAEEEETRCVKMARLDGYTLTVPKGGKNGSLTTYLFDVLKLPVLKTTEKGNPSLDEEAILRYQHEILEGRPLEFMQSLLRHRGALSNLQKLEGYRRFWLPVTEYDDWWVLHPSTNQTGTDTLRFSCNNPNAQNWKKDPDEEGYTLRHCLGPLPGREWWSMDLKNLERRLPAYEAGEEEIIALLERPDDPPYYGSEHALVAHIIHPKLFEECRDEQGQLDGRVFKKRYAATWYQWLKNGNFAIQYGAQRAKADATYRVPGAYDTLKTRFSRQEALNQQTIRFAEQHGYVETLPDRTVDPKRGYPLMVARTEYSRVLPTVPFNYKVQGTACWIVRRGMVRCQTWLDEWRQRDGFDGYLILNVHDELVFDFPRSRVHPKEEVGKLIPYKLARSNLWRARILQELLAQGGMDLIPAIPTPCGLEYHEKTWAEGVSL